MEKKNECNCSENIRTILLAIMPLIQTANCPYEKHLCHRSGQIEYKLPATKRVQVTLPYETYVELKAVSKDEGCSMTKFLGRILEEWLEQNK